MTKYYRAQNVGQKWGGIDWNVYDIVGGSACAVYATEVAEEQAKLAALIADKKPVSEISSADYDSYVKKKAPGSMNSTPFKPRTVPQGLSIKGEGAVVVESKTASIAEEAPVVTAEVATLDDALKVGSVEKEAEPTPEAAKE